MRYVVTEENDDFVAQCLDVDVVAMAPRPKGRSQICARRWRCIGALPEAVSKAVERDQAPAVETGTAIFIDTEFTDLGPNAALLSIGAVTEAGHEFYVEVTDGWSETIIDDFVRKEVLPLLGAAGVRRLTLDELARAFAVWINRFPRPVRLLSDSVRDEIMIRRLYSGPRAVHMPSVTSVRIRLRGQQLLFNDELNASFLRHPDERKHYALNDARSVRGAYLAAKERDCLLMDLRHHGAKH